MKSKFPVLNVYKKKTKKSSVVTQLLYGDTFKKLEQKGSWIRIKNDLDNYKGYIKNKKFNLNDKSTHKVYILHAKLYSKPNEKNKIKKKLSFGSKIKIIHQSGKFLKFDKFWIKKNSLKKINFKEKNYFKSINKFINVKYKWGGKYYNGIDCSALVQLCLNNNQKFCPRDTKDQIKFFKNKISLKNIKKNDLIFWRGHVAVVISKKN